MLAMFGAGCFWGVEDFFSKLDGVLNTTVGYSGGDLENPTYPAVCKGDTAHAEVVLVDFDEKKITYEQLLKAFWQCHDASLEKGVNSQYRSCVFFYDDAQKEQAISIKSSFEKNLLTEITPVKKFYKAEEYHQKYIEKQKKKLESF